MFDFGMTNIEEAATRPGGAVVIDDALSRLARTRDELVEHIRRTSHPAEQAHAEKVRKGIEAACFVLEAFRTAVSDHKN